jgi:hypothetical protein
MVAASFLQKLIIGGLDMALQPLGFVAPVVVGMLLGFFVFQVQLQYRQRFILEKRARAAAEQHYRELEKLNQDLRTFDYSISNALRTPVRQIHGYLDLIEDTCRGESDISILDLKSRLKKLIQNLNQLLDALLDFSRVSRNELKPMGINLTRMVKAIIHEQKFRSEEREVTLKIEEDLHCSGDHGLLRLAVQHLVDNAFEYSDPEKPLELEFGRLPNEAGDSCYYFSDNGPGISPRDIERVFVPFHSFHTTDAFNGIGMGLPIVKRVIERHGGRVWIESEKGSGTRVCFTLAK